MAHGLPHVVRQVGELLRQIAPGVNRYDRQDGTVPASRTQAAIRRCGELLRQIEPSKGGRPAETQDGAVPSLTRTQAAPGAWLPALNLS